MLLNLAVYSPLLLIALVAQWGDRNRVARWSTYGLLIALNGLVALGGAILILVGLTPEAQHS